MGVGSGSVGDGGGGIRWPGAFLLICLEKGLEDLESISLGDKRNILIYQPGTRWSLRVWHHAKQEVEKMEADKGITVNQENKVMRWCKRWTLGSVRKLPLRHTPGGRFPRSMESKGWLAKHIVREGRTVVHGQCVEGCLCPSSDAKPPSGSPLTHWLGQGTPQMMGVVLVAAHGKLV